MPRAATKNSAEANNRVTVKTTRPPASASIDSPLYRADVRELVREAREESAWEEALRWIYAPRDSA